MQETSTRSPGARRWTLSPTSSTVPTASWPRIRPGRTSGTSPARMCRSVPQIVVASTRTITSPSSVISGSGTSSQARSPGPWYTSARITASSGVWLLVQASPRGTGEGQRPKVPPDGLKVRSPVSWAWLGSWVGPLLRREGAAAMADRVIEELSEDQCLNLISGGGIGRIAYTGRFGPAVLPVNYVLQDGAVVFRTAAHGPLDEDLRTGITDADYKVAFEIDSIDLAS